MTDQHRLEELKTASEARAAGGRTLAAWERMQAALRRYVSSETYREKRNDEHEGPGSSHGTGRTS